MLSPKLAQALGAWAPYLSPEFDKDYMAAIGQRIHPTVCETPLQPSQDNIFRAFSLCQPGNLKVVIIGQDPYPGGEADGLCFSSGTGTMPYSLRIIFEELESEGFGKRTRTSLEDWAEQGVLLLNTHLTTEKGKINAHSTIGWNRFTGFVINFIAKNAPGTIFMLWGKDAYNMWYKHVPDLFRNSLHVLKAHHPAAQRYGYKFVGCGHFKTANSILLTRGLKPIQWTSKEELLTW